MIGLLTALFLFAAAPAAPDLRVRDTEAPLPDSGAVAERSDTTHHAVSRTPDLPPPVVTLPPVRVDARLASARRRAPTAFVTLLPADDGARAMASLPEALAEVAGVHVTQYGGLGAFSSLSLRGAPAGHVTVLMDGVPLTSAAHGVVDLAGLPVTAVEAIELYRGAGPASLATPTPGGAVNLLSRASSGLRELRLARGSFGTGEAQASLGARRGAWSLLAHGGWQGSDGDYRYRDDNGTPLEPSDDIVSRRVNARFDAATALLRAGWAPGDRLQARAHVEYFRRGQGVPGTGATPALTARHAAERWVVAAESRAGLGPAWPALEAHASLARERDRLRDTGGELGLGRLDTRERFGDATLSLEATSPTAWRGVALRAGGAVRDESADPAAPTAGLPSPPRSSRATGSAWVGAQLGAVGDRVLVIAGRRWDRQTEHVRDTRSTGAVRLRDSERTLDSPQLGARLRPGGGLELRANWSRSARAPEFDELFGLDGAVTGNPTLRPERAESWDAGAAWEAGWRGLRLGAEWSHHATHARDLVLYERSSPRGARPVNVGAARLFGEETSLRAGWRGFELTASTAWLSATDRSPVVFYRGRRLPQRAERQSYARLAWRDGTWSAATELESLGDTFLDRANLGRRPARTLVGARLGRRVGRVMLVAEGRNLGDRLAEDVAGFPLPGRTMLLSCVLDFGEGRDHP